MTVSLNTTYTLTLKPDEFNLIGRALRGELRPEEIEEAQQLQRLMAEKKVSEIRRLGKEADKLADNLQK